MLSRRSGNIKRWIDFIIRSKHKLSGLKTFASGMLRDIEAVKNGINMHWSNGCVEEHVNRIKKIKSCPHFQGQTFSPHNNLSDGIEMGTMGPCCSNMLPCKT